MTATYQGPQPGVGADGRIVPVKTWLRPSTYRALAHHAQQRRVDVGELISLLADQSMSDREGLRAQAEKQSAAYAKMLELNGGVGKLGVQHPEMFDDMLEWDRLTANQHADTVIMLLNVIDGLERDREALINKREALILRIRSFASEAQQ